MKKISLFLILISLGANMLFADCFDAKSSTFEIAQQIRHIMKSSSKDAGKPKWHFLSSSKKGLF